MSVHGSLQLIGVPFRVRPCLASGIPGIGFYHDPGQDKVVIKHL